MLAHATQDSSREAPRPAVETKPATGQAQVPTPRRRSVYIDSLRAIALLRVFTFHSFGWAWLPLAFPSMGVMFALAGSLMASSLDRKPGQPAPVVGTRIRRLLPPLWFMGVVLVPAMLLAGWTSAEGGIPLTWQSALLWLVPVGTPPGSDLGADWVLPLWYIRTYLWFVLLAPMTLWLYRHWPRTMLALVPAVAALGTLGVSVVSGAAEEPVMALSIYGACWLVGYARHDGTLQAMRVRVVIPLALALCATGLAAGWLFHDPASAWWVLDATPMADALYGLGFTVLLLRFNPSLEWVRHRSWLSGMVSAINARAVTLYLWGNVAIWGAWEVVNGPWEATLWQVTWVGIATQLLTAVALWILAVLAFGWVEDLAARRPLRVNPWPKPATAQDMQLLRAAQRQGPAPRPAASMAQVSP